MVLRFLLIFYTTTIFLGADEISELVSKIQHSENSQKRILLNKLKEKLKGANNSKRVKVISALRKGMHTQHTLSHSRIESHHYIKNKTSTSTKQHSRYGKK